MKEKDKVAEDMTDQLISAAYRAEQEKKAAKRKEEKK